VAERLLRALCALWAVPAETLEQYTSLHKPAVQLGAADISIGRGTLPLLDAGAAAGARQALQAAAAQRSGAAGGPSRFAPTGHVLRNMERVAVAASRNEPVLLVGETGTGKTTLVQQICKQVRWGQRIAGLGRRASVAWMLYEAGPLHCFVRTALCRAL
jgi:midasin